MVSKCDLEHKTLKCESAICLLVLNTCSFLKIRCMRKLLEWEEQSVTDRQSLQHYIPPIYDGNVLLTIVFGINKT